MRGFYIFSFTAFLCVSILTSCENNKTHFLKGIEKVEVNKKDLPIKDISVPSIYDIKGIWNDIEAFYSIDLLKYTDNNTLISKGQRLYSCHQVFLKI